ncbi:MAG: YqaJ viral recombinase family protein [Candidatus Thermoplasmatota archaeon]|nr:YqaJ viral recombinase family protein [Candidatus Thermoplasmatota archaeon]
MIILPVTQGSEQWKEARLGIPTASRFGSILTPKTMRPSSQADGYIAELVAEWILGQPLDGYQTEWMERGSVLEQSAVKYYEVQRDVDTEVAGFCLRDDRRVGCSPDRLVGKEGGLEIKAPSAKKHMAYLLGSETLEHRAQVQGNLWICKCKWWDVMSYNPEIPALIIRYERDEEFIAKLSEAMELFLGRLAEARARARELGCVPMDERLQADLEKAAVKQAEVEREIFGDVA